VLKNQKHRTKWREYFIDLVFFVNMGVFLSAVLQMGFLNSFGVFTVQPNIIMNESDAYGLPGLAARAWAVGGCLSFLVVAFLGLIKRISRRVALIIIVMAEFLSLFPIMHAYVLDKMPVGAGLMAVQHCVSGSLTLIGLFLFCTETGQPISSNVNSQ